MKLQPWHKSLPKRFANLALRAFLFLSSYEKKFRAELIASLEKLKEGLAQEGKETQEMLEIYYAYSQGKVSKEEMEKANAQFRDLIKAMGLGFFLVLPFAPVTIPLIVKIGQKLGVNILPSSFQEGGLEKARELPLPSSSDSSNDES